VAGVERRRAFEQEAVGEDDRQGAEQGADAMPVLAVGCEAERHVRPCRLIAHVVALAPEAEDSDAVAVVDELLSPLQRARVGDIRTEKEEVSPGLCCSCRPGLREVVAHKLVDRSMHAAEYRRSRFSVNVINLWRLFCESQVDHWRGTWSRCRLAYMVTAL